MAKAVKMADIAKVMGVSTVTVSKALSNQKGVSEELRVKIKKKAEEMGYKSTSDRYKERTEANASYTFGVIVSDRYLDKYESFYWNLYQEVATAAVQRGCFTMLEVLWAEDEKRCVMPKLLQERKTDGLILIGNLRKKYIEELTEQIDIPLILLDFMDQSGAYDAVISNSYFGMYRMTNYLFDMGHREIGFLGNVLFTDSITDRYFGYVRALYEHGVEVRKDWVLDDRDPETGRSDGDFTHKLPEQMPTAFVCNNDVAAAMLVNRLEQEGYRVPEDISVVGYDNYQPPGLCDVRITTYEVDMPEMARQTIAIIIRKISGEPYKQGETIVSGRIICKESVKEHHD
ncbi:MAG: LacI family DNA-binding transcriptional regulator [Lachnospiraceae bacterium]|nr:LacI family DNA-binding transcriptional regulator [Lachnospiraceae bacterium]